MYDQPENERGKAQVIIPSDQRLGGIDTVGEGFGQGIG